MKAVGFTRSLPVTDPESFLDLDLPKPVPQGRDILVAVKAVWPAAGFVDTEIGGLDCIRSVRQSRPIL